MYLSQHKIGPGGTLLHQQTHTNRTKFHTLLYFFLECDLLRELKLREMVMFEGAKICRRVQPDAGRTIVLRHKSLQSENIRRVGILHLPGTTQS